MAVLWEKMTNLFNGYKEQNKKNKIHKEQDENIEEFQKPRDIFGPDARDKNPHIGLFNNAQNNIAEIIDRRSMLTRYDERNADNVNDFQTSIFQGVIAMPLITNKAERIRQYRSIAQYPDCDFCLCELADDFLHEDESGEFVKLNLGDMNQLDGNQKEIVQNEFKKFINLFQFKDESFNYVKKFLIDGELAFENIINPDMPNLGIIGIKYLPTEYYETIISQDNGKTIGITFDQKQLKQDLKHILSNSAIGAKNIFNNMLASTTTMFNKDDCIPFLWPQITYISSGDTSPDGLIQFPLIEKCKMAYHQQALMQDAAIILRVTRAPERLLFNINVGGMSDKVARQRLRQFENEYKSKKIIGRGNTGGENGEEQIQTIYNPVTMLETFFAGKTNANDGTTVETVSSTADYEQITDIEFFLRKLFKAFKVPFSRFKVPENELSRNDTINYEEYSMSRYEIRMQRRFAMGLKRSFITHLKLRKLWTKYNLKENDLDIAFVKPLLWDLYETQKLVTAKMEIYEKCVEQDELSKISAMKKYLGMSDEEIDQNFKNLIKEKQYVAMTDYFGDMVSQDHRPIDYVSPIRLVGIDGVEDPTQPSQSEQGEEGGSDEGGDMGFPGGDDTGSGDDTGGSDDTGGDDSGSGDDMGGSDEGGGDETPSFGLG